jgi:hypothetical protein
VYDSITPEEIRAVFNNIEVCNNTRPWKDPFLNDVRSAVSHLEKWMKNRFIERKNHLKKFETHIELVNLGTIRIIKLQGFKSSLKKRKWN